MKWAKVEEIEAPKPAYVPRVTLPAYIVAAQKEPAWTIQPPLDGADSARGAFARMVREQYRSAA